MLSLPYTLFTTRTHKDRPGVNHIFVPAHEGRDANSLTEAEREAATANPFGRVELHITAPEIQTQLEVGKTYRIDITEI